MNNFFSHSYASKFSFFTIDDELLSNNPLNSTTEASNKPKNAHGLRITKALTMGILETFTKCNPKFFYDTIQNPKRCLTYPPEGIYNNGYDNINNEYILYVNDIIRSPENHEYQVLELLGKGTFGQVVRCLRRGTSEEFALKVIKNKPAYTNQALMEVKIYKKLKEENKNNEDYIVRLYDYFVFRNHICLIMELLHVSLFDLLKLSNFSGFSLRFIGRLTVQILEGMACLEKARIVHCDLKPENILFADDQSDVVKLIDLGSSCFVHSTLYTYIQSRFYRAPEVILGMKYTNKIDSWSLGCIVAEFYLGLPIFPGSSEYDQLKRIIELIGTPENDFIETARFKNKFFKRENENFTLKTVEEFEQEQDTKLAPHKKYFILNRLEDLEMYYSKSKQREKNPQDRQNFACFLHFLRGLLTINPQRRWTASQALCHPFLTNETFTSEWEPPVLELALETFEKKLLNKEIGPPAIQSNFLGFSSNVPTQSLNVESQRPYVPPTHMDKKEEVMSQAQNVSLFNSQMNSTKQKSKLNPHAASFNASAFQVPSLDAEAILNQSKAQTEHHGSNSEPNSARSLGYKPRHNNNQNNKDRRKNDHYSQKKGDYLNYSHQKNIQYTPKNQREETKSQEFDHNQYTTQHGDYSFSQQKNLSQNNFSTGFSNYRQRSNSDQAVDDTTFYNNHYNKKYTHGKKRTTSNLNQTGIGDNGNSITLQEMRNQPTPDTAETSYSSNEFEFKSKFASAVHHRQSQQDEAKEEFKEEDLL